MRLVSFYTLDAYTIETSVDLLKHFVFLRNLIENRDRTHSDSEEPIRINLSRSHLQMLLRWGEVARSIVVKDDYEVAKIRDEMTDEERWFLLGRPIAELKEYALLAMAIDCRRLMMAAAMLNREREEHLRNEPNRLWDQSVLGRLRRSLDDRNILLHRRRLWLGRSRYD